MENYIRIINFTFSTFNYRRGGEDLKKWFYKLICLICVFVIFVSTAAVPVTADEIEGKTASVFAYTLNDAIYNYGVVSTEECGGYINVDCDNGIYPTGVIYADIINFDNNETPYLVIFRADNIRGCISVDIYEYNTETKTAELVTVLSKGLRLPAGVIGEFCLGFNAEKRFIVYNEYTDTVKSKTEYYTVMDGTAFQYVTPPEYADEAAVVSFSSVLLHPETDVSFYNYYLDVFFSKLKNASANSVTLTDISEEITDDEEEKIENVLAKAAKFCYLDISEFNSMYEYETALANSDSETLFYLITHMYDLGDEMYYVRFSTDCSFYNYAVLRRTNTLEEGYQILSVRTDSIPLSDVELSAAKEVYDVCNLVMKKASGSIDLENEPVIKVNKLDIQKPLDVPKLINTGMRVPIAIAGGGICLVLLVGLWIYMASDDK